MRIHAICTALSFLAFTGVCHAEQIVFAPQAGEVARITYEQCTQNSSDPYCARMIYKRETLAATETGYRLRYTLETVEPINDEQFGDTVATRMKGIPLVILTNKAGCHLTLENYDEVIDTLSAVHTDEQWRDRSSVTVMKAWKADRAAKMLVANQACYFTGAELKPGVLFERKAYYPNDPNVVVGTERVSTQLDAGDGIARTTYTYTMDSDDIRRALPGQLKRLKEEEELGLDTDDDSVPAVPADGAYSAEIIADVDLKSRRVVKTFYRQDARFGGEEGNSLLLTREWRIEWPN